MLDSGVMVLIRGSNGSHPSYVLDRWEHAASRGRKPAEVLERTVLYPAVVESSFAAAETGCLRVAAAPAGQPDWQRRMGCQQSRAKGSRGLSPSAMGRPVDSGPIADRPNLDSAVHRICL